MKKTEIIMKQAQLLKEVDFLAENLTRNERIKNTNSYFNNQIKE